MDSSIDSGENEIIFVKLLPQVTLLYFLGSRRIFWDFITLSDLSYDYGENETNVNFFEISWFYWIHLMILEKMRSCMWKLELGFWTCSLIHLLGPTGPYVVSKSQTPRSWTFFRFHNLIGFILSSCRKWGPVCKNWSQCGSAFMASYTSFGPK